MRIRGALTSSGSTDPASGRMSRRRTRAARRASGGTSGSRAAAAARANSTWPRARPVVEALARARIVGVAVVTWAVTRISRAAGARSASAATTRRPHLAASRPLRAAASRPRAAASVAPCAFRVHAADRVKGRSGRHRARPRRRMRSVWSRPNRRPVRSCPTLQPAHHRITQSPFTCCDHNNTPGARVAVRRG